MDKEKKQRPNEEQASHDSIDEELTEEEVEELEDEHRRAQEESEEQDVPVDPGGLRARGRYYYGGEQASF